MMKFSCTKQNLTKALSLVSHIATKNTQLPILQNILFTTNNDHIIVKATNLEVGIEVVIRGKVEGEGSFTVPASVLSSYVQLLSNDRVDIECDDTAMTISSGSQNTKIRGVNAGEFPLIPVVESQFDCTVNIEVLKNILPKVVVTASHDQSRVELTGVLWSFQDKKLTMAATDSHRLSEAIVEAQVSLSDGVAKQVVIPSQSLVELSRIIGESEETEVKCLFSDAQVLFVCGDVKYTSRLLEVAFPEYQQIIPNHFTTSVTVKTSDCVQSIKAASLFSKAGIHDVSFHISPKEGSVTVTSVNAQVGENVSKMTAQITGEEELTVIFNYRYILDGLSHIGSPEVRFDFINITAPAVLRPIAVEAENYFMVIMPIKQ